MLGASATSPASDSATHPAAGTARGGDRGAGRQGHPRGHVHGVREVGHLPDRRPAPRRPDDRRLAAHLAAGGPDGRGRRRARRRRGDAELHALARRARAGSRGPRGREHRVRAPRARAAGERRGRAPPRGGEPVAARRGRGALRVAVGPRLPPRVPAPRRGIAGAGAPADPGAHGDRGAARPRRHRPGARDAGRGARRARVRPAGDPAGRRAPPRGRAQDARAAGLGRRAPPGPGHRLRDDPARDRGARARAGRARRALRCVSRRDARPAARGDAGGVHGRRARST